jgi:hypothetical protein
MYAEQAGALKHARIEFLFAELTLSSTFLDLASVSRVPATIVRNHKNALKAYRTVLRYLRLIDFEPADRQAVTDHLSELKDRLRSVGQIEIDADSSG